jgi:hypothetical protein
VIDTDEALSHSSSPDDHDAAFGLHLKAKRAAPDLQDIFDEMVPFLDTITVAGRVRVKP